MLRNKIYYALKPYVPWRVRIGVRRWFAQRKRAQLGHLWPIAAGSERPAQNWPGWPGGKKFALILTHDVERQAGLGKCRALMELEQQLGFRSSFNFVPEGEYRVSRLLRDELTGNGFEVGVHDLHHDGKLYGSRRAFARKAGLINHYLREWKAVGFRSGFMLHNLDWLHDLGIQYDSSTFDTDPFEPQPDGVGTVFPFWVPRHASAESTLPRTAHSDGHGSGNGKGNGNGNGNDSSTPHCGLSPDGASTLNAQRSTLHGSGGYVELPYTLPQDSTLFLLFRQRTPDIWFEKLDWVARHGGMAALTTHPDYMCMNGGAPNGLEYPVSFYRDLLEYARRRYGDSFWQPLPVEVAAWYRREMLQPAGDDARPRRGARRLPGGLRGKRAAVVVYSGYPGDARPRRELGALLDEGMSVDLLCLREKESEPRKEIRGSLRITRPQARRERRGKIRYFWEYGRFWLSSFWLLSVRSLYRRYDLVHVHNMPDVLVFSALVPRLLGAKIILDLHDPMPELMMTIFGLPLNHSFVRFLKLAERASMRFADRVVAVNLCCKRIFSSRSCLPEKVEVVMNTPDPQIFKFRTFHEGPARDGTRPLVIMYHGSIVERSGLDLAVEAVGIVREKIPNLELRVYGPRTPFLNRVLEKAADSPAEGLIRYMGPQSLEEIAEEITRCDVGIIPNRRNIFTELNTPIRILEYLSRGKPVIAPRAPGITDYFGEEALPFFELGDAEGLARQIEDLLLRPWEMKQLVERGQKVYLAHSWGREREQFLDLVAELLLGTVPASSPPERAATPEEEPATVST